jgi:hypothetical protein
MQLQVALWPEHEIFVSDFLQPSIVNAYTGSMIYGLNFQEYLNVNYFQDFSVEKWAPALPVGPLGTMIGGACSEE